jgi:hypothetical protein
LAQRADPTLPLFTVFYHFLPVFVFNQTWTPTSASANSMRSGLRQGRAPIRLQSARLDLVVEISFSVLWLVLLAHKFFDREVLLARARPVRTVLAHLFQKFFIAISHWRI